MAADRTSSGFGAKLRDARERRGVSLREIANATKISVNALEALERNDISRLPGGIFSRAFVRSYAIEVGLDPDTTIQDFIAQFPGDGVTAGHPAVDNVEDGVSVDNDRRMAGTFLWLIGISLPIAGAILYFATAGRGRAERQPAPPPSSTTAPGPDAKPAGEPPLPPASLEPTAAAPPSAADPTPPAATVTEPPATAGSAPPETASTPPTDAAAAPAGDRLTVTIAVKRPCWVSASVDGQQRIERLLQPGEQQTIEVKREMVLTAGDASAVALAFNGASARPLGKTGEVVTARFNLNNYKDYVLQSR